MSRTKPVHVRVRELVDADGLSIADVARLTGWAYLQTMRRLNGDTELSAADMEDLARALKKPVAVLYGEAKAS
jgi:transcriptional regulator with XRE-family HTH domain